MATVPARERTATCLVALFVLTIVAFLLAEVIPGDPARTYAGPGATPGGRRRGAGSTSG